MDGKEKNRAGTRVLKFGGTSVATGDRLRKVAEIVERAAQDQPVVVVVSALGGMTNGLDEVITLAVQGEGNFEDRIAERMNEFVARHHNATAELANPDHRRGLMESVDHLLNDVRERLRGAHLLQECSPRSRDSILAVGEELASLLLVAALRQRGVQAEPVRGQELLLTDSTFGDARVDLEASRARIEGRLRTEQLLVPVVPGFTGADSTGQTTTLGRGGSDYTAAILGAALGARAVELWTDVPGVMSADPRLVANAFPLPSMTYAELLELAHFGAGVVYPPSVAPARRQAIPLWIKNTFAPEAPGTLVATSAPASQALIRGVASIPEVSLLGLAGGGLAEVTSAASRLLGALAQAGAQVLLISQSSVEGSITVALRPADLAKAREIVEREFALEVQVGWIDATVVEEGLSVVTAVGEGMRDRVGVSGRLFGVLGRHGINVRVTVQSSSERSITVVVAEADHHRAVRAVHDAFFGPQPPPIEVLLAGVGQVGSELLEQIAQLNARPGRERSIRVVGVLDSRGVAMLPADGAAAPWRKALAQERLPLAEIAERFARRRGRDRVFVDCTASDDLAAFYPDLLRAGVALASANKRPFAGPQGDYDSLIAAANRGGAGLFFEATVGAGLPVLATLADLERTGDRVTRIDGVLSGTLNFVLDQVDKGTALSDAVREAHRLGYTEPHPAEDLAGDDVARKLCILARRVGMKIEPAAIACQPLIELPAAAKRELGSFWNALRDHDEPFAQLQRDAAKRGQRLRYVARLRRELEAGDQRRAVVGVRSVDATHPCFGVRGADNLVAIHSERYSDSPIVIRGPGAGPAVTAAGVLADLLRAAQSYTHAGDPS